MLACACPLGNQCALNADTAFAGWWESGTALPTASRVFRRWAVRRLPWDRAQRGGIVSAYVYTLLTILFCPWRAGRALVLPDNWPRTVRWANAHLLLAVVAGALLHNEQYFAWALKDHIWPSAFMRPSLWTQEYPPGAKSVRVEQDVDIESVLADLLWYRMVSV